MPMRFPEFSQSVANSVNPLTQLMIQKRMQEEQWRRDMSLAEQQRQQGLQDYEARRQIDLRYQEPQELPPLTIPNADAYGNVPEVMSQYYGGQVDRPSAYGMLRERPPKQEERRPLPFPPGSFVNAPTQQSRYLSGEIPAAGFYSGLEQKPEDDVSMQGEIYANYVRAMRSGNAGEAAKQVQLGIAAGLPPAAFSQADNPPPQPPKPDQITISGETKSAFDWASEVFRLKNPGAFGIQMNPNVEARIKMITDNLAAQGYGVDPKTGSITRLMALPPKDQRVEGEIYWSEPLQTYVQWTGGKLITVDDEE